KAHRTDNSLLGNRLDLCLRAGQDSQTKGLPIGPDSSLAIAELLLAGSDLALQRKIPDLKGFRYYDDYEFYFDSAAQAEGALPILESALGDFELTLNPTKSGVERVLQPLDLPWSRIRRTEIRVGNAVRQ